MAVGERLRMARLRAGLSQRELARRVGLSAQAISKYERDLDVPSSGVLLRLVRALNVSVEYLLRPATVSAVGAAFRCQARLNASQQRAIIGCVQDWLERYLDVESLLSVQPSHQLPPRKTVSSVDEAEEVALSLRHAWGLGEGAVENLGDTLEEHGIKVKLVDAGEGFDACTLVADGVLPVIAINGNVAGDRQRFSLAHELGHLVMEAGPGLDAEKATNRFAGAFLVPGAAVRKELGEARQTLTLYELHVLKHKYGLSMQGWVHRAEDLGILSRAAAQALRREFRRQGWQRYEPGDQIPLQKPAARFERLVVRALTEDVISRSRAAELLGEPPEQFLRRESQQHGLSPEPLYH